MNSLFDNLRSPLEFFCQYEKDKPTDIFLRQPTGTQWKEISFKDAGQEARKMAAALISMGLTKGDHIGIISKNCYHWILSDLAIMMAGCVSVPFYASLSSDELKEVLIKSDTKVLFVGKLDEWDKKKREIPPEVQIIHFPHYPGNALITDGYDWDELVARNPTLEDITMPALDELWTILFTSGTTGTPKGVMHTYRNAALVANNEIQNNALDSFSVSRTKYFSFLPLNHIAERAAVELCALLSGGSISFAENLDTFAENLRDTQPTFFFAVPRIWTKFQLGILAKIPQKKLNRLLSIPIISAIVKKKIKKSLGLNKTLSMLTGASITPESLKQWYRKIGLNLREVYGMTENFGGFTLMPKDYHKPNTVGRPMANSEARIDPENGEILMKMSWLMTGYYKDPELTAKTIEDGWLRTGDKGSMDDEGFVKIIGRVKDAFKTTKGKFIVPTTIEEHFSHNDYIEQICVAGLGISQPVVLICLSEIGQKEKSPSLTQHFDNVLDRVNAHLHGHEKISTLIITKEAWSEVNKLLTPTLKIRREAINEKYGEKIRAWHEQSEKVIWES